MSEIPAEAVTADPRPEGNPALAAATEAIVRRHLATMHSNGTEEAARVRILLDALPDAAAALEAAAPLIETFERDLLTQAEDALHSVAMRLLAVSPQLKVPYTDMPEQSPWSMTIGPQARRAHDLALAIREHLGLPFRHATRALGTPPLEAEDVISQAAARVTRFEVIHRSPGEGRAFVRYDISAELAFQDEDRTLKVFLANRAPDLTGETT
jgi:hypothetical protein